MRPCDLLRCRMQINTESKAAELQWSSIFLLQSTGLCKAAI